jgi:hypothetical protein
MKKNFRITTDGKIEIIKMKEIPSLLKIKEPDNKNIFD